MILVLPAALEVGDKSHERIKRNIKKINLNRKRAKRREIKNQSRNKKTKVKVEIDTKEVWITHRQKRRIKTKTKRRRNNIYGIAHDQESDKNLKVKKTKRRI